MGGEMWTQLGSSLAGLMFIWAMFKQYFPFDVEEPIKKYTQKLAALFYPYIHITFHEHTGDGFGRLSKAYAAIERYLSTNSTTRAKRLKADMVRDSKSLILTMDDYEEITDEFKGLKVWWASHKNTPKGQVISWYGEGGEEKRYYQLKFHRKDREIITELYLKHVMDEGKAIEVKNRQRKLYTNNRGEQWDGYRRTLWSPVVFEHPATFDTLAMEETKKKQIINDLITFTKSKDYYKKIGRAWKRGYLLFGPPGTGKSTMIAAMANLLEYDVYDLELTAVKDNTELRKLLINASNKSIIVIEDIDCSLDLIGQRKKKEKDGEGDGKDLVSKKKKEDEEKSNESSKVTLSGLLNFIDGLWFACGGERIIVFTTNYVERLDPALIRRGRMDKHIELSYCCFEAFKVLARNYLDLESHYLFETIKKLLEENNVTPADVAENLMPKSHEDDADVCLANLIDAIKKAKEEAKAKAEEEEKERVKEEEEKRLQAEKEEKEKEEKEQKRLPFHPLEEFDEGKRSCRNQYSDATFNIFDCERTSGAAPDGGVSYMEESMRLNEMGEVVTKREKLSPEDKESLTRRETDEVSNSSEEELKDEMWSEELEETPSDPRELAELNCYRMKVPPTISHHFSILRVLDLSYTEIKSLPQSISRLVALQKLYLRNCECLMQLPPEIGELTNLEVLDLEGTEILCLPKEIAKLVKLTCLRVSFYGYANQTVIPRKVLSNLSRLNELIIDVTPYGEWWDVEVEAIIDDLGSLKELRALNLYLPTAKLLEELTLIFSGLANFRFTVGRCEEHFISRLPRDVEEEFNNREKLEKGLKYVNGDRIPNEITKVFKHVNAFFLQCHWTANSLSEFGHANLNEVKFCLVMECNEFRTIIDSEQFNQRNDGQAEFEDFQDFDEAIVLGSLERLIVRYMKNMESIWKGPVGKGSMSSLKSLALHTCPNLTTLFTIDMLSNLKNLEELIVEDCPKIDSLVSFKNSGSKSGLFLPSLKKISLLELPGLVSISSGLCIAPKLERMVVFYCPKLEKLSTMDISSTNLKVIKGEEEWWNALKWYESDLSTEHEDYLTSLFIPLRRNGDLFAQLTED